MNAALVLIVAPAALALALRWAPASARVPILLAFVPLHAATAWALPGEGALRLDGLGRAGILGFDLVLAAITARLPPWRAGRPGPPDEHAERLLLGLLAAVSLVHLARDLALVWLGLAGTLVAAAPLVAWRQQRRALEAAWRLGALGLLGLGLALLGLAGLVLGGGGLGLDPPRPGPSSAWSTGGALLFGLGLLPATGLAPTPAWRVSLGQDAPAPGAAAVGTALAGAGTVALARFAALDPEAAPALLGVVGAGTLALGVLGVAFEPHPTRVVGWLGLVPLGLGVATLAAGSPQATAILGLQRDLLLGAIWLAVPAGTGRRGPPGRAWVAGAALAGLAGLGPGASAIYAALGAIRAADGLLAPAVVGEILVGAPVLLGLGLPRVVALARSTDDLEPPTPALALVVLSALGGLWLPAELARLLHL